MVVGKSFEIGPIGYYFKKLYCPICGEKLKKTSTNRLLLEPEKKGFYKRLNFGEVYYKPVAGDVEQNTPIVVCEHCNYTNGAYEQVRISKIQKKLNKKILTKEEMK